MAPLKMLGRVAVLAAALPLSGCAALFGGYDVAPNGLPVPEDALRRDLAQRPGDAYTAVIEGSHELPDDDLLRLLYAGTAGRYAGAYDEGGHLLDLASYVAEDRVTTSVSRQALSFITSDRALEWVPGPTERLMIPYLAAATYLEAGNLDAAAVEARRIESLLDRVPERDSMRRFLHLFAGTIFEAAGDANAADVAYRRAGLEEPAAPDTSAADTAPGEVAPSAEATATAERTGEVVVLVESGFVPHQVEQSVVILVPPWQMKYLTDGEAGEKAAAAAEAAARVLLAANDYYGDRRGYYRDRGYRQDVRLTPWKDERPCRDSDRRDCDDGSGEVPYLLRISWPVLYQEHEPRSPLRLRSGALSAEATARLDVANGARQDFEDSRGTMLARTMLRAASKMAISSAAQDVVEKKDTTAGEVVGFLANLGTLLTERADIRCWHLLPGHVSLIRMRMPAGTHDLTLELDGPTADGRSVSLGSVEVEAGETAFVTHRIWR